MIKKLDKLLNQLINLHPKYIDLSLVRLEKLLDKIDNPHLNLPPVIHLAGTNGKGSTLSYIRNILMENRYKVHAYISPHLTKFNERIILSNNEIKTKKLLDTLLLIKKINANEPITFYEITTAAAFYLFANEKADFLLLETGLGGRLDATNIIKESLINIITPIGLDHQEFLGKNIYKIANEKLGIIKESSKIIISKQKNIINKHIKKKLANNKNTKLYYGKEYKIFEKNKNNFILQYNGKKFKFSNPTLLGEHQVENVSTAITAILKLKEIGYSINVKSINNGIIHTKWPGRIEKGKLKKIKVYLDGAHNIDGAKQLFKYFKKENIKVWLVLGMLNNKNIKEFLKILKPIIIGIVPVSIPNEKNSYTTEQITDVSKKLNIESFYCKNIDEANLFFKKNIKPKNILVTGSLYLIGSVRKKYL